MPGICDLEPFLYASAPVDPVAAAAESYYGDEQVVVSPSAASSSGTQINEQSIESYLERMREALCTDLEAIEARITALET